jgi:two-component system, OmpR family, KDP operon response regulator KdpE
LNLVLDGQEFDVVECSTGKQAIQLCVSLKPDIVLLDLQMPDMPGQDVIIAIREWSQVPVIIVSSHQTDENVISGLNMGADDYVIKPFNTDVLRARINASLRKSAVAETGEPELTNGPLRIDLVRHQVFLSDTLLPLTPKEYDLLRYFMVHQGKMLNHRDLLREVWGAAHIADTQYLRVFIGQIREKIEEDPRNPRIITTELGIGYRMELMPLSIAHLHGQVSI